MTYEYGPFCSHCGGDRREREPGDPDGYGCLENIYHFETAEWERELLGGDE
ncbi:hypothetical protein THIBAULT_48 [Mycobacterium phage Thibault]|uniref:Uncharacterized protein n=1 Tax=Mycobacterium phage Thibault TaxID=1052673 RepID=G1FGB3_9CAUD|nr:hypothetical protein CL87_gp048 [Mycobacterium phage Thibault]AEJ94160.1 hypothetical protein THIBAULT_48 [Mycobacterium phage Thibault]AXF51536.1 hypothetical protein CONSTELLA_46 [Mycobacterium phage Constella]QBI98688.1 hypothetical protein SEA_BOBBY_55 [Mycobacterium phage Bobby]